MLTKKSNGVANGPRLKKALAGVIGGSMDRRTFLKRSGLTAGGAALAAATPLGMAKQAKAKLRQQKLAKSNPYVRTAQSAAPSSVKLPMVCGLVRSLALKAPLTWARTAQKELRFANTPTMSGVCATR